MESKKQAVKPILDDHGRTQALSLPTTRPSHSLRLLRRCVVLLSFANGSRRLEVKEVG